MPSYKIFYSEIILNKTPLQHFKKYLCFADRDKMVSFPSPTSRNQTKDPRPNYNFKRKVSYYFQSEIRRVLN